MIEGAFGRSQVRAAGLLAAQIDTFFPNWFVTALKEDRKEILDRGAALALPLLGRLMDDLSKTVAEQRNSETFTKILSIDVTEARKQVLVRGILRQAVQILAGSEAAVAAKAANLLLDPVVPETPAKLLDLLGQVLVWALDYGQIDGHTGLVLIMGRDLYRGRLFLTDDGRGDKRLSARLPPRLLDTSSVLQERVLRVLARDGWHGELRTNPAWTTLGRRLTVHNQGGCPMGPPDLAVTSPLGEVHDCPGLYVMDAAAFPTSVGVNPSATIAAVAEFKVEQFIRAKRDREWTARDKAHAKAWVDRQGRADIDPLNQREMPDSDLPKLDVLTLSFKESVRGFFDEVAGPGSPFDDLGTFPDHLPAFTDAEEAGIAKNWRIEARLTAKASDLARLIASDPMVSPMKMKLWGVIALCEEEEKPRPVRAKGFLQLFVKPPQGATPPVRFFRYVLQFAEDDRPFTLRGHKVLRDSPGFDIWSDTSTVYFEIQADDRETAGVHTPTVRRGILRISIEDFLQGQLRSIKIEGTVDTARKSWALAAFYRYFVGELATVYMKRADALKDVFMKALTGIHV